jgi:hypothetical protein
MGLDGFGCNSIGFKGFKEVLWYKLYERMVLGDWVLVRPQAGRKSTKIGQTV